ncbi:MAG TPA: thioredoxin family protein [Candidatus Paceibacterota bacterium]
MIKLSLTSALETVLNNTGRVVLLFSADWCSQCTSLKRDINHLPIVEVDADKFPELATRYNVRGLPTVVEVYRPDGATDFRFDQERSWTGQALRPSVVKDLFA